MLNEKAQINEDEELLGIHLRNFLEINLILYQIRSRYYRIPLVRRCLIKFETI